MQKKLAVLFMIFIIVGIVASAYLISADDSVSSTNSLNLNSSNANVSSHAVVSSDNAERNQNQTRETDQNQSQDRNQTQETNQTRERDRNQTAEVEVEVEGHTLKIHAHGINATKLRELLQERNRLKLGNISNATAPNGCTHTGSVLRCYLNGTRIMTVHAGKSGNVIVQVKGANMTTNVTLYKSNGTIYGIFNNETFPIVLPDQIRERIRERIKASIIGNETNITLNNQGQYEVQLRKAARLFGIFPVSEQVKLQMEAQNGTITSQNGPWWGFLASDVKGNSNSNSTVTNGTNSS